MVLRQLLLVTVGVACSACSGPAETHDMTTTKPGTKGTEPTTTLPTTPRSQLPAAILPHLPMKGIYAAGGGLVSSAWRVVVDLDRRTVFGGSSQDANAPSYGKLDKETTRPLSAANEQLLWQLARDAWAEPPSQSPPRPTADYDEILVVVDGDDAFYLQGYGPIRQPRAAKAITELRAAAGL